MYLHDVYGMFKLPEAVESDGGGCNFSIALVLLCVIDSFASEVYPNCSTDDGQHFKKFVRDRLWPHGTWRDTDQAMRQNSCTSNFEIRLFTGSPGTDMRQFGRRKPDSRSLLSGNGA
jgi:hypothetical protein